MALSSTGVFEVDGGNGNASDASNAGYFNPSGTGAGTDLSLTAPIACTDLVIGATNTQVTSASITFASGHARNGLRITAGTGFTAGLYEIISVSGGVATLDRAAGTAGSTGGTARVGGPLASPGQAGAFLVAGTTLFIKYMASSYSCTATNNVAGGTINTSVAGAIWGYNTTRTAGNADALRPTLIAAATSGVTLIEIHSSVVNLGQLVLDANTNTIAAFCFSRTHHYRIKATRAGTGIYGSGGTIEECEANACGTGFNITAATLAGRSTAINCTATGFNLAATGANAVDCHAIGTSGYGFSLGGPGASARHCTARGSTGSNGHGFWISSGEALMVACRAWGVSQYGFNLQAADSSSRLIRCAAGSCTAGNTNANWTAAQVENFTALTADPDANPAGLDYAPNAVAGGGALVRGIGFAVPGTTTTSYRDLGAAQAQAPTPASVAAAMWSYGNRTTTS